MKRVAFLLLALHPFHIFAQAKVESTVFDGLAVVGFVDEGGFLNFTGPNLKVSRGHTAFTLGMLPSLRLKKDRGTTKNTLVYPTLGFGLTCLHKNWAFQLPLYYNPKTGTQNGTWVAGFGLGFKFNGLNKPRNK